MQTNAHEGAAGRSEGNVQETDFEDDVFASMGEGEAEAESSTYALPLFNDLLMVGLAPSSSLSSVPSD